MAHLKKLPTFFVKGDERRAAYFTVQVRELRAKGFVEEGEETAKAVNLQEKRLPEIVNEVGSEPFDSTDSLTEPMAEVEDLDSMTKSELLDYAMERGVDLPNNGLKSEILALCKEIQAKD